MKKRDFINMIEDWLVKYDIKDVDDKLTYSEITDIDINDYCNSVVGSLALSNPILIIEFLKIKQENRVRGMK